MHKVDFGVAFWCPRDGVDMMAAKVATNFQGILDRYIRKILVTEGYDFLLSHE